MTGYDGPIKNTDLLNLREYVTAETGSLNKADSTVLLMVTHSNLKARFMEIRFDRYVRAALTFHRRSRVDLALPSGRGAGASRTFPCRLSSLRPRAETRILQSL